MKSLLLPTFFSFLLVPLLLVGDRELVSPAALPGPDSVVCGVTAFAGEDLVVCAPGGSVQLSGFFSGDAIDFYWEPAALLNNPNVNEPVTVNLTGQTAFTFNVVGSDPDAPNLVNNGSFGQGNTGFTSNYTFFFDGPGNFPWMGEARYSIVSNSNDIHSNFASCNDQDGNNAMMVVNAAGTVEEIWCQVISVQQQTAYNFSAWVATVVEQAPAILQFTINSTQIGNQFNAPNINCQWNEFTATWNSGNSITAELCILNLNTALSGNDFAIDNIGFFESCVSSDQVVVDVLDLDISINSLPQIDCNNPSDCVVADVNIIGSGDFDSFLWTTTAAGQSIQNAGSSAPTLCGGGQFNLIASRQIGPTECTENFSVTVTDNNASPPAPTISGPPTFCPGIEEFSVVANNAYDTYNWELPSGAVLVNTNATGNIITLDLSGATENDICLSVANFCGNTVSDCFIFDLLTADTVTLDSLVCTVPSPGSLIDTIINPGGCDTILITRFMPLPADTIFVMDSSCSPLDTGVVITNLPGNNNDCDTVLITTTTLLPSDTLFLLESSCSPLDTGVFETLLPGAGSDCDTTVFTTVLLSPADTIYLNTTSCMPSDTGLFIQTINGGPDCDTVIFTQVDLIPLDTIFRNEASCMPSDTGLFQSLLPGPMGCDTVLFTQVDLIPLDTIFRNEASCMPSDTGLFQSLLPGPMGCDTVLFTQVDLIPLDTIFRNEASCMPSDTGLFQSLLPGPMGCDTVLFTQVDLIPLDTIFRNEASCMPSDTGLFQSLLPGPMGCDTVLFTQVDLIPLDTIFRNEASCMPSDTGLFQSLLPGPMGCDTVLFTQVDLIPLDTIFRNEASCMPSDTGLFQSLLPGPMGCDTVLFTQVDLIPLDTIFRNEASCMPSDTGLFQSLLPGPMGCDTVLFTQVDLIPLDTIFRNEASCMPSDTGLFQSLLPGPMGCDTVLFTQVDLIPLDTIFRNEASCMPSDTGLFQSLLPGPMGCDTVLFTQVDLIPLDTIFRNEASCMPSDTGWFQSSLAGPMGCDTILFTRIDLIAPDTILQNATTCDPLQGGVDVSTTTDADGCMTTTILTTTVVPQQITRLEAFSCDPNDFGIDTLSFQTASCDSLVIIETLGNLPILFETIGIPEDCSAFSGGRVIAADLAGGSGVYTYRLNGGIDQTDSIFTNVPPGNYQLIVTDDLGCSATRDVSVGSSPQRVATLGSDRVLRWGDSVLVRLQTDIAIDSTTRITWSDEQCLNCVDRWLRPLETTNYRVTIIDSAGCSATATLNIRVEQPDGIYVANGFSPNGDGVNDVFLVQGDERIVDRISGFEVYSRWGESVFSISETRINTITGGWDGNFRGQPMDGGVFIYHFTAHYPDGSTRSFSGEVALIR